MKHIVTHYFDQSLVNSRIDLLIATLEKYKMKLLSIFSIILIFLLLGVKSEVLSQEKINPEDKTAQLKSVIDELDKKPKWLILDEICPVSFIPNQQKPIKYLSEECEKNPSKCLNDCKNEDGNACYSLALLLQQKIALEVKAAEHLFLLSCKYGIASGCTNYAAGRFGSEDAKILKCSVDTFEKTCEMEDSWGCAMFGLALIQGISREKNQNEAVKYLKKACVDGETSEACKGAKRVLETIETQKNK